VNRGKWSQGEIDRAADMYRLGATTVEIAAELNRTATFRARHLKQRGADMDRAGVKPARLWDAMKTLPREVQTWLLEQVPNDATPAEIVAAIILDAYHDDTQP